MRNYNRALYISITALVIYTIAFVVFIFYSISHFAFTDFYKRLNLRCNLAAQRFLDIHDQASLTWSKEFVENLANQREFYAEIDAKGKIIQNHEFDMKIWNKVSKGGSSQFKVDDEFFYTDVYLKGNQHYVVGVSAENYFYTNHLNYLRNLLIISVTFGILLVIVISLIVKRSFIMPIYSIIADVEHIGSKNLDQRLTISKDRSVLNKLAKTFNQVLTRLETSFETQKNFISNASHELNTPLTSIIGVVDLALSKERTPEEYRASLQKIMDAAEHLEKKTNALLLLARTGYENKKLNFKPVRIDQIILDAEMTVRNLNSKYLIKTDFSLLPDDSMRLKVNGVSTLLQLALSNIISNGCKYSEDHTCYIALGVSEKSVLVLIKDHGIGIPEEELEYIYDPYFRASNTSHYSGYGIGLPLSRNIIHMHTGVLNVKSELGIGTTVTIEIPSIFKS